MHQSIWVFWEGDVFWADIDDPASLKRHDSTFFESQVVQSSDSNSVPLLTDRYMGYTVAEGIFAGQQMVVSSAPKESLLNNDQVTSLREHIGRQGNVPERTYWTTR
ncbi:hypothetical protein FHG87_025428 [Trinorchestia longiramus]|nr:hypothetical protein FHG87_025428 [Trinorchestia longiramus]